MAGSAKPRRRTAIGAILLGRERDSSRPGTSKRAPFGGDTLGAHFLMRLISFLPIFLVSAITAMVKALGCEMIAEGVEQPEQLEALRQLGCDYAQGWLVGKPVSLREVLEGA